MASNTLMFPQRASFERKLVQLFLDNDSASKGYLTSPEVDNFLIQLSMPVPREKVITSLLERIHDKDKDLKTVLLKFCNIWELLNTPNYLNSSNQVEESPSTSQILHAPPKFVIGSKKYGRRSLHYHYEKSSLKTLKLSSKRNRDLLSRQVNCQDSAQLL